MWEETLVGFTAQHLGICVQLPAKAQLDFHAEDELISASECQFQLATGDLVERTYRGEAFCFGSLAHDLWAGKIPGSFHVSLAGQKSGYAFRQGAVWFMLAAGEDEEDAAA